MGTVTVTLVVVVESSDGKVSGREDEEDLQPVRDILVEVYENNNDQLRLTHTIISMTKLLCVCICACLTSDEFV